MRLLVVVRLCATVCTTAVSGKLLQACRHPSLFAGIFSAPFRCTTPPCFLPSFLKLCPLELQHVAVCAIVFGRTAPHRTAGLCPLLCRVVKLALHDHPRLRRIMSWHSAPLRKQVRSAPAVSRPHLAREGKRGVHRQRSLVQLLPGSRNAHGLPPRIVVREAGHAAAGAGLFLPACWRHSRGGRPDHDDCCSCTRADKEAKHVSRTYAEPCGNKEGSRYGGKYICYILYMTEEMR